jgi:selenocysteine lyase/cysteine desulfurase
LDFNQIVADFIGASSPGEVVPMFNTAQCANAIAGALPVTAGDNVVFCDVEFPSNAYPWMVLERDGIEVRKINAQAGGLTLDALKECVDERTKFVEASAIQFFTGHRTDLAAIGAFCRARGIIFYVDAIQAIGHMKFDVEAMKIDILATGGQKSLMSVPGVGFMYVRYEVAAEIAPRTVTATSNENWLHWTSYDMTPLPGAGRFHPGSLNVTGMFGVMASISLFNELTPQAIDQHTSHLADVAIDALTEAGYTVITPRDAHGPIVTFVSGMDGDKTDALVAYLDENKVNIVKHLSANGDPHLRLSFHCYNKVEEFEHFLAIMRDFKS